MIEGLFQDLRHGARMLVKNPGFAFVAIVSIAIGVGANAAMFSLADTLVLRPLSVPQADDIVTVTSVVPRSGFAPPTCRRPVLPRLRRCARPGAQFCEPGRLSAHRRECGDSTGPAGAAEVRYGGQRKPVRRAARSTCARSRHWRRRGPRRPGPAPWSCSITIPGRTSSPAIRESRDARSVSAAPR